ncbi:NDUFA12 domain-containing protein [Cucumis melo var. makuwa]|uniref:NDUFA12 domain-containing protein n=1 Tax=Cucumis melo var. makuwa TaxID=1194695 RepID=A0A5A7SSN7_CUCMM|nr:NDUFA12 domain-containing protein [Cucumis melo var. makuwa]
MGGRTGFADDDCLYFIAAVEWICWLNGQRKKAPTPEEMMELEARRERVRQNVALLKKEEMERNSKEGKLRKIISTGQVMSPDLKSFIRQVPTGSEGTQTKRMQFERNQFQSPPSLLGLAIHLDPEHGSHMNDDCPSRRTRQH